MIVFRIQLLLFLLPIAALAAEVAGRSLDGSWRFWVTLVAVQMATTLGYGASSLPQWAKWRDGSLYERLVIVQGFWVAMLAGNIAYYGSFYYLPSMGVLTNEVGCFIGAAVAGFGGDRFLTPLLFRITGKIQEGKT
jgi:hypothetical protein